MSTPYCASVVASVRYNLHAECYITTCCSNDTEAPVQILRKNLFELHLIKIFRALKFIGPFVLMIYTILSRDLSRFFLIYSIFLIGFSQCKYVFLSLPYYQKTPKSLRPALQSFRCYRETTHVQLFQALGADSHHRCMTFPRSLFIDLYHRSLAGEHWPFRNWEPKISSWWDTA